jgi:cytochrome P450
MNILEPSIESSANDLIDHFGEAREIDFAAQFSVPFPSQVFLTLMGLPLEDLPRLLEMKDGIVRPHHVLGTDFDDPLCKAFRKETAAAIYGYFDHALDDRQLRGPEGTDILSGLLHGEVDGRSLSREELLDTCFLLMIGGLDTVSASLDCFFAFLSEHPGHRREIVEDPSLIPSAVEEMLRVESPVMLVPRRVTQDTELRGCPLKEGDHVLLFHGAANTDTSEEPDADDVQFGREANRHFSFGGGVHRCLGAHLARLELRTALRVWHARIPDYRIPPEVVLNFTAVVRTTETFPMILGESLSAVP